MRATMLATYKLTISQLGINPGLTSPPASLTDAVLLAQTFVPAMDGYTKV